MRNFVFVITISLMVISCSKNNSYTGDLTSSTSALLKSRLDSITNMNNGSFLASDLTVQEIDSIAKITTSIFSKQITVSPLGPNYTDLSGLIHIQVYWDETSLKKNIQHLEVVIDTNYVLVGGGAQVSGYNENLGSFLYESRPDEGLTKWRASSKAHIDSDPHYLSAWALGMKIDGVSSQYLRSKIHYYSQTSYPTIANHPHSQVQIPTNCLLLGGGAFDDWHGYGNMLTASYPLNNYTWYVAGKDHRRPDPCFITAYAIYIENVSFPGIGYLEVSSTSYSMVAGLGSRTSSVNVPYGWALTCPGGFINYTGNGRMIVALYSNINVANLTSKDNTYGESDPQVVYALMVKKAQ